MIIDNDMFEYLHQLIPNSQKRARLSSATAQTAHLTCCPPSLPALAMVSLASSSEFSPFPVSVLFVPVSGSVGSYSIILVLVGFILVIVVEFEPAVVAGGICTGNGGICTGSVVV